MQKRYRHILENMLVWTWCGLTAESRGGAGTRHCAAVVVCLCVCAFVCLCEGTSRHKKSKGKRNGGDEDSRQREGPTRTRNQRGVTGGKGGAPSSEPRARSSDIELLSSSQGLPLLPPTAPPPHGFYIIQIHIWDIIFPPL